MFGVLSDFGGGLADSLPNYRIENAAFAALNTWVNTGTPAPTANPILTLPLFNIIEYDQYGNAEGGVRLPEMDVPIKTYTYWNLSTYVGDVSVSSILSSVGNVLTLLTGNGTPSWPLSSTTWANRALGICLLEGFDTPFSSATLNSLYSSHADYVNKYTAAAQKLLNAGFLLQADYNDEIAEAQAAAVP